MGLANGTVRNPFICCRACCNEPPERTLHRSRLPSCRSLSRSCRHIGSLCGRASSTLDYGTSPWQHLQPFRVLCVGLPSQSGIRCRTIYAGVASTLPCRVMCRRQPCHCRWKRTAFSFHSRASTPSLLVARSCTHHSLSFRTRGPTIRVLAVMCTAVPGGVDGRSSSPVGTSLHRYRQCHHRAPVRSV